jgi:hypothetical protein
MDHKEIGCEGVDWIHLALDRDHWRVSTVMNLPVPKMFRTFWVGEQLLTLQEGLRYVYLLTYIYLFFILSTLDLLQKSWTYLYESCMNEGKLSPCWIKLHAIWSGGIAPRILNIGIRWGWTVSSHPWRFFISRDYFTTLSGPRLHGVKWQNYRWIAQDVEGLGRPLTKIVSGICLEGLNRAMKNLSQDSRFSDAIRTENLPYTSLGRFR